VVTKLPDTLRHLAESRGVRVESVGPGGSPRTATPETVIAVLAALGVDAGSPSTAKVELDHGADDEWRRVLPPSVILRRGTGGTVAVHVAHGDPVATWIEVDVRSGGGRRDLKQLDVLVEPRTVDGRLVGRATFEIPDDLPLGWHRLFAEGPSCYARSALVVTPKRARHPDQLAGQQLWGWEVPLYAIRSDLPWRSGDLADLAELAALTAGLSGPDFLAVHPLPASSPSAPLDVAPHVASSRRFLNPLYIRVEDIRETAYLSAADRTLIEWQAETILDEPEDVLNRDAVWTAKKAALDVVFAAPCSITRQRAFDAFRLSMGPGLEDFAAWCALAEHFGTEPWPRAALERGSGLVCELRASLAERIEYFGWLQWVADEQLRVAHDAARDAGMALGLVASLAPGSTEDGADAWTTKDLVARGIELGVAPSRDLPRGALRGVAPWRPDTLARAGYEPLRLLLRTRLRHCGALHLGEARDLFEQWWVPAGNAPADGAWVRNDHEAVLGLACLEARRAGVALLADDRSITEDWMREALAEHGIVGAASLWPGLDPGAGTATPETFRTASVATVTHASGTPTAGYLAGEHVELRQQLGLARDADAERRSARAEREGLHAELVKRGLLGSDPSEREFVEALHRYVASAPSLLMCVSMADGVGERRPPAVPAARERYPSWRLPLIDASGKPVTVVSFTQNPRVRSLAAAVRAARRPKAR